MNGGYRSPPCYASEVAPDYFGAVAPMTRDELLVWLRRLLADERMATRGAAAFVGNREAGGAIWTQLAALRHCGLKNCATLMKLITRVDDNRDRFSEGAAGNAPDLPGPRAQVEWLADGERRCARFIHGALPNIEQDFVRQALIEIEDSHLFNIEACEALLEIL